ncbi:hypothetical protein A0256_21745 [Mucilaginibacter sp. PAMC 26640]|nr:hypothetical protein A0256_21745 [Mucilaginibacter sp. PAMC 26640]
MYWYKPIKQYLRFTGALALLCCGYACKPEIKETGASVKYFDLKEYFRSDSARLAVLNPEITKTVSHNGDSETKKMHIPNWGREFGLFKSSDINKPAWKDSYTVQLTGDSLISYKAKFPELKTREIVIRKSKGKVISVAITNDVHNLLYQTIEKLTYVPNSYYLIEKKQHVKVMGENDYLIKGVF